MGFLGHWFASIGYPCFFAFADVLREVMRVAEWGGVGLILCYALPLIRFEGSGKSCHSISAGDWVVVCVLFLYLCLYVYRGRGKMW